MAQAPHDDWLRLGDGTYVPPARRRRQPEEAPRRPPPSVQEPHPVTQDGNSRLLGRPQERLRIFMAGAGSVGGHLGLCLAQMNCDLDVGDRDQVDSSNLEGMRTPYPPETVGMPKVTALDYTIQRYGLPVRVTAYRRNTNDFSDRELQAIASGCDVSVAAFDDPEGLLRFNRLLYGLAPVIYPAFHHGGRSGHIIWTRPREVACFACAMGIESADHLRTLHREAALPMDIQRIAQTAARVALWLCARGDGELAGLLDPRRNILYMDNRPGGSTERSLAVRLLASDRNPSCPICGSWDNEERR